MAAVMKISCLAYVLWYYRFMDVLDMDLPRIYTPYRWNNFNDTYYRTHRKAISAPCKSDHKINYIWWDTITELIMFLYETLINRHMEFSPFNNVVKYCLQGMDMEEKGKPEEAGKLFLQGWDEATNAFEKFLAAHYVARHQKTVSDQLKWLETALEYALKINDDSVKSAFPALYLNIAKCYEALGNTEKSREHANLAALFKNNLSDKGPFYHGTKANLQVGDLLTAGGNSNYQSELKMNHIYFTAMVNGAGLAAALAKGDGRERVYIVEPTGNFENDPNVTDKKFPGNPTRSYRSQEPLKIVGEVTEWVGPTPENLQKFREKLANNKGEIIN